eukprot:TRINITY_DN20591_c0_g1_i6.p1 TRINITY_DN20591_c0_g1~~TRINITY_DN20591_c0_g1_i6.p1  ORF type:complete len:616 (-),score=34.27 TRINITY_DN20591_c0_g1_i6:150-1997(-)
MASFALETYAVWLSLALNLASVSIYCLVSFSSTQLFSSALSQVQVLAGYVRPSYMVRNSTDSFEPKVAHLAVEARLECIRELGRVGIHVMVATVVISIISFGWYDLVAFQDTELAGYVLHRSTYPLMTLGLVMCMYCWLFPRRVGVRTLHVFHALVIARLLWQITSSRSVYDVMGLDGVNVSVRICAAWFCGVPQTTLGFNVIYACVRIWKYSSLFSDLNAEHKELVKGIWGDAFGTAPGEFYTCAAVWIFSHIIDTWKRETVRANLLAKTSSASEQNVKSLLVVMCDAVVTVDEDFRLNTASSDLAHFLVRCPPNSSYQGVSFLDFLENGDRQRVQEQLASSSVGPGTALSLLAGLVDGNGTSLKVHLYCTGFIDIDDNRAYVIGILEVKDPDYETRIERRDVVELEVADTVLDTLRGTGALHAASEPERASAYSAQSAESAVTVLPIDHNEYEVFIDVASPMWPVICTSLRMRQLSGPPCAVRQFFFKWLRDCEVNHVVNMMSQALNKFQADPEKCSLAHLGRVQLRPPHAAKAGLECMANITLDLSETSTSGPGPKLVCLRLSGVALQSCNMRRRRVDKGTAAAAALDSEGRDIAETGSLTCASSKRREVQL